MLKISPKLIDVESNRVEYVDEKDWEKYIYIRKGFNKLYNVSNEYNGLYGYGSCVNGYVENVDEKINRNKTGRFPTQMFYTGDKKELYKYVKNIS